MKVLKFLVRGILSLTVAAASLAVTTAVLLNMIQISGSYGRRAGDVPADVGAMDRYDMYMTNQISAALDGVLAIDKVYWLSDEDTVAPEPNQSCYGSANSYSELTWLLEEAADLIGDSDLLFSQETPVCPGTQILYYYDDTILVLSWKENIQDCMYTICEVKLAHPSQFRRFLSGGAYGSNIQLRTTEMAASVNAVLASSGDFYANRRNGVIVYEGVVQRVHSRYLETCYIDDQGNMSFSYLGELPDVETAQQYVDDNNIRFSIAFGPVLVENGVSRNPMEYEDYIIGSSEKEHSRIALCQRGPLHYYVATAGQDDKFNCWRLITLREFHKQIEKYGCVNAYTLDGGQTATIVMNDELINRVAYDSERNISDIIYFATAIPSGE